MLPHFSAPLATGVRTTTSTIALPSHSELQHYDSSPTRMCLQSSNQPPPELQQPSQSLAEHVRWPVTYTLHQVPGSTSGNITGILLECVYFTIFLNKCCEGKEGSTCSVSIAGSIEPVRQINHYRRHSQYFYCQVDHLPILNLCLIFWFPCQCWHTEYFLNQKI